MRGQKGCSVGEEDNMARAGSAQNDPQRKNNIHMSQTLRFSILYIFCCASAGPLSAGSFQNGNPPLTVLPYGTPFVYSISWSSSVFVRDFQLRKPGGNISYYGQFGYSYTFSYPIPFVDSPNEGEYFLYIGSIWPYFTDPVALHVSPAILVQPQDTLALEGAYTSMGMVAGPSGANFQWIDAANGNVLFTNFSFSPSLTNDGQSIFCKISNSYGSLSTLSAVLTVRAAPTITTQPADVAAALGSNATFSVTASGSPPLYYQWYKNGIAVPGANLDYITLTGLTSNDAGKYAVSITNLYGSIISSNATLTVVIPPARLSIFQRVSNTVNLQINGAPGFDYVVESATNSNPYGNWFPILTNVSDPNGTFSFTVSSKSQPSMFFRVKSR